MSYVKKMIAENFIEYASYVIKERAIPDIDDGMKPVQRRILHSLNEVDDGRFNKVANVVGNTMKYHPHGDASIYSSLVVLANKDLFLEKQGNFGNIYTGDEASAARYIECRLSHLARETLFNKDLTEYADSYDGRNKEPVVLPAKIPNLLLMGAEGIAVGMSTKILPHNMNELLDAQIKILKKLPYEIYPDFPTGGLLDISDYNKGNGRVRIRAVIEIRDNKTLVIKEIPYGTTTQSLITSVETAAKKGKVRISSINDYTAEKVEIELKTSRGEEAEDVLKALYAYTDCEITDTVNLITIVNNKPRHLTVNHVLEHNTKKLIDILKRELEIEKDKLENRLHAMTLEMIFIENRIYKNIEELKTYESILSTVFREMSKFKAQFIRELKKDDIESLLQIRIKRISRWDIDNHRKDMDDIVKRLNEIKISLKDIRKYTVNYIGYLKEKYGSSFQRKTKIVKMDAISVKEISQPDVKMFWDKENGFLGTDVKGGHYFLASPFDKFLVIDEDLTYKVIPVEGKRFLDNKVVYLDKFDEKKVFSVIYTDLKSKFSYAKKFSIKKYVTNKVYPFPSAEKCHINYISTSASETVRIVYKKKPKQKINEEYFAFKNIEIKSVGARGLRVSNKQVAKVLKR